ncbi:MULTISPECIES: hypothetical protein [unclassified Marinobacter]|uniref:hypothetical protein n=1 Tax=unclassified Marinobacter TaxID=83889 RepID=UPI00126827F1|nr:MULTISPECIES: hypothetical protein [unclassified Marinobacter]QFS86650.1 hypothetical protein FIV08_07360 [Marinobacter sp. THAF197a]QFT50434.1 hypothetical protein FIU96_07290 [Marinobacter sp. THAF39]QFT52956.1 hypothetical protein FIU96_20095 [Marinobacter sp. THAF39]
MVTQKRLERRLQLNKRRQVDGLLYRGFTVVTRDPLVLRKGRQLATLDGGQINYENTEVRRD